MQHLMPHRILRMCVYVIASACRETSITQNNLTGYLTLTYAISVNEDMLLCASLELHIEYALTLGSCYMFSPICRENTSTDGCFEIKMGMQL